MPKRNGILFSLGPNARRTREAKQLTQETILDSEVPEQIYAHRSAPKNFVAVVAKKIYVGFGQLVRQTNRPSFKRNKVLLQCWLWKKAAESLAQNDVELFVESYESGVERRVVKRGETKAVAWIQSLDWKLSPRHD